MAKKAKKSLLVTGGLGFIGSHIVGRLSEDYRIVILDWDTSQHADGVAEKWHQKGIPIYRKDVAHVDTWNDIEPCDFVFHGAAQTAAVESEKNPDRDIASNAIGTLLAAEYARKHSIGLIYCNTIRVYDSAAVDEVFRKNKTGAIKETCDTVLQASGWQPPFAYSKYFGERFLHTYSKAYGLQVISHRMSGVVGPGQVGKEIHGWVSYIVRCAFNNRKYTVFGDGTQSRDILHISDYVELISMELRNFEHFSEGGFAVYNIGGGIKNRISINGLIDIIRDNHGLKLNYDYSVPRRGEPKHYVSDLKKVIQKGWQPKMYGPEEIIKDIVNWYNGRDKDGN